MTDTLNQTQLAQIVSAVLAALNTSNSSTPKAASISAPVDTLAQKDRSLVAGFKRKGIPVDQIKLMDRSNPKADYNIRPFKGWLEQGRMVKKGEKSIRGLFHITQTSELPKASAKPVITAEQKTLFETAKKVLKAKKGKAQPTLV
jgi:hypothetical protein